MRLEATQKLELLDEIKKRYPIWINEELLSLKFCKNAEMVFIETSFKTNPKKFIVNDIEFMTNMDLGGLLFSCEKDIVDNAKLFLELDPYSHSVCVNNLFNMATEDIVNESMHVYTLV